MSNEHEALPTAFSISKRRYEERATPSDTLERREAKWRYVLNTARAPMNTRDDMRTALTLIATAAERELALSLPAREVSGERVLRREGIVAFSADIENPRVLKLHFDQDVTSAHRTLILDAINARRAALATTPAPREKLEADLVEAKKALRSCVDALTAQHQWHAAQTDPDPEHGFVPADEYADSALYDRTVEAISAANPLLADGPVNTAARCTLCKIEDRSPPNP